MARRLSASAAIGVALAAAAMAGACASAGRGSPAPQPSARTAAGPSPAVTIQPIATPGSSVMPDIVRARRPGPLAGELVTATPAAGRCRDPYVTPTASPEPPSTPADPAATPTPERIFHPADVPAAATPDLPPVVIDAELERRISGRLGDQASHYAVLVKDLSNDRGVSIDGDRVFYAASLFKLEVMYEIFHQRAAGLLNFGERYVPTDYYTSFGLGPRLVSQCEPVSIADALTAMMAISDNTAAVMLQDRAGAGHVNDAMTALGLQHTRLTEDQSLPGTAADFGRLLEAIARGQAVDREASQAMADLLATETINDRIPRELPPGTLVAHKTGNWTDATHDAGIVYGERSAYVMVLMSDIGPDGDAGSVEADIAKIAWDYFEGAATPAAGN
ncbi:MAG TPA: serine hydrolase [Dehalococcoidia bacterium]|nr:serine hydrolase [Dehalococcoidia bacterium]